MPTYTIKIDQQQLDIIRKAVGVITEHLLTEKEMNELPILKDMLNDVVPNGILNSFVL